MLRNRHALKHQSSGGDVRGDRASDRLHQCDRLMWLVCLACRCYFFHSHVTGVFTSSLRSIPLVGVFGLRASNSRPWKAPVGATQSLRNRCDSAKAALAGVEAMKGATRSAV